MTLDNVQSLADLLVATRIAAAAHRMQPRVVDSVEFLKELGESNAIARDFKHEDAHHVASRLSYACLPAHAAAEQANLLTLPAFVAAACRALG